MFSWAETEQIGQVETARESEFFFLHRDSASVLSFLRDFMKFQKIHKLVDKVKSIVWWVVCAANDDCLIVWALRCLNCIVSMCMSTCSLMMLLF